VSFWRNNTAVILPASVATLITAFNLFSSFT
jgi:hypothetical protein